MIIISHLLGWLIHSCRLRWQNLQPPHKPSESLDAALWSDILCSPGVTFTKEDGGLGFDPPVYRRRYNTVYCVIELLPRQGKIVDFGCAELKLFTSLKLLSKAREIILVDIDRDLLKNHLTTVEPQISDYHLPRDHPLTVSVYSGSAADYDSCLDDVDVVIAVELIEHLYADTFEAVVKNIFGNVRAPCVIITTPNSEFNVLFTDLVGFRHDDHKFEWTRLEFQNWAENVVRTYPDYKVKLYGVGPGPEGSEHLGCCSQMAVFIKTTPQSHHSHNVPKTENYSLVIKHEYPYDTDTRTVAEKLSDMVHSWVGCLQQRYDDASEIPLLAFLPYLISIAPEATLQDIRTMLETQDWTFNGTLAEPHIIVPPQEGSFSSHSSCELPDAYPDVMAHERPIHDWNSSQYPSGQEDHASELDWDHWVASQCETIRETSEPSGNSASDNSDSDGRFDDCPENEN